MGIIQNLLSKLNNYNAFRELTKFSPRLNTEANKYTHAEELVDLLFSKSWERFFWIKQVRSEIINLGKVVENKKPKVVVEIGTNTGGTLFLFAKLADPKAHLISIDLPGGQGGGGYPEHKSDFFRSFAKDEQKVTLLRLDSHKSETLKVLKDTLGKQKIDFLFLDGDHSFDGIKQDFEMYSPLVNDNGCIAFHDIKQYPKEHWIKVKEFWDTIKGHYKYDEYIDNSENWGGIGVLFLEKKA